LPFDSAPSFEQVAKTAPVLAEVAAALARADFEHPYLLFRRDDLSDLRKRANKSAKLGRRFERALRELVSNGASDVRSEIKRRTRALLCTAFLAVTSESRAVRERALAATKDMLSRLASAPSWKERPVIKSFLDCAEVAIAVSLAYDWLFQALSADERAAVEAALSQQILQPALAAYEDRLLSWPRRRENCTAVSNSGVVVAALAVARVRPELAAVLLRAALGSAWSLFDAFAPDGAWHEGLSYWALTVRHAALMVAALESSLGDSFGLADRPGFGVTGDFASYAAGPSGLAFNFGDSTPAFDVGALAWFSHRFGRPIDGWLLGDYDGWQLPFTLIWPRRARDGPIGLGMPTGKVFGGLGLACFRNTWRSEDAARPVYFAIKGGNGVRPGSSGASPAEEPALHAQADAGTFIIDGAHRRWAVDLGADDYDLPGYFDHGRDGRSGRRWRYYRNHAVGHNTLVIDGANQIPDAATEILGQCVEGEAQWVVFDLSAAYGRPAGSVCRGAALIGRQIVIQDEIAAGVSNDVVWTMHTAADTISIAGRTAALTGGCDRFVARILEPENACFTLSSPPPPRTFPIAEVHLLHGRCGDEPAPVRIRERPRCEDDGGEGRAGSPIRRLQIVWPRGTRRLSVVLLPDCGQDELVLPITPLDDWLGRRPLRLAHYRPGSASAAAPL
jgi:hypothetical protein